MLEFICVFFAMIEHNCFVIEIDLDGRKHSIACLHVFECKASVFPVHLEPNLLVALLIRQQKKFPYCNIFLLQYLLKVRDSQYINIFQGHTPILIF